MPETTEGYRVPEVCKVVGISYRQLDYWARTGLVTPSIKDAGGSGTQRLYSFQDLVLLRAIRNLLDAGVSLQSIRHSIDYLRKQLGTEPTSVTLVSDGRRVYACTSPGEIVDLLSKGQGVFAIALDKVWDDLSGSLAKAKRAARTAMAEAGGA
ncbi:MAG TPA: MerR family transcriptional regulator [Actinomycetota bacterium]|nr:MerR family transcriptional regulator [Actinomycetota bacterium]